MREESPAVSVQLPEYEVFAVKYAARDAGSPGRVIPGHDPLVLTRYPPATHELTRIVARLD